VLWFMRCRLVGDPVSPVPGWGYSCVPMTARVRALSPSWVPPRSPWGPAAIREVSSGLETLLPRLDFWIFGTWPFADLGAGAISLFAPPLGADVGGRRLPARGPELVLRPSQGSEATSSHS